MLANGVEPVGCPTWVPEDYSLQNIEAWESDGGIKFVATYYSSKRGDVFIRVSRYDDSASSAFEKEAGGYIYTQNGIDFDVVENMETINIEWQFKSHLYSVVGPLENDEKSSYIYYYYTFDNKCNYIFSSQ